MQQARNFDDPKSIYQDGPGRTFITKVKAKAQEKQLKH
jgi:hypothetical protein